MEAWVPLFDIFLNSPTPESEASLWLNQSFSSSSSAKSPITTASFVSLLMRPFDAIVADGSSSSSSSSSYSSSPPSTRRVMFIQTLPDMVQTRILLFLAVECQRFCQRDLCRLARDVLGGGEELDFWVERAARNLLDAVSDSNYEWISHLSLDSGQGKREQDEFDSVPVWLRDAAVDSDSLPWLPISPEDLNSEALYGNFGHKEETFGQVGEDIEEDVDEVEDHIEIDRPTNDPVGPEIQNKAASLKSQILSFESTSKTVSLANEIRQLCMEKGVDAFAVLSLIEPWLVEDETASILISHLSTGNEEELTWPSQVLCSIILPKFLALEEPVSRVLLTATIEYCKLHQKAAVYALLFPLILRGDGINNSICDVITRIVKECLHPAHVSAFCQKLLCGGKDERRVVCLPCHRSLLSDEMVWSESLFNLFQSILNQNVCLTQDSVDHIVYQVQQSAQTFSKSLRFGNFLLCLVTKCSPLLKCHKLILNEAVEKTNTLVTKSILSKLFSL
ncbi:hypothetical protein FNV43_RR17864 [Rhamnella rubrinervis]|uniref:Fanconi Anaemia group E protein C-terminal domain-containing protein n=1 Tax=Rhamnella rubrinervis TaxID=2594499 RepID=A0A8K0GVQ7_9ROSA|nr:hypothetical protein FNV43_RR17864 [Rhamnella rubrinervis]